MGLLDKFIKHKEPDPEDFIKILKLHEEGKHEECLAFHDKIFPDKSDAYYHKGNYLGMLERFDEALESYRKAIKLDEKYIKAHYQIGILMFCHEIFLKANDAFRKVIQLEVESSLFEWTGACAYHLILCSNYQYQDSKDPRLLDEIDIYIAYLQSHFKFDNGDMQQGMQEGTMEFFKKNYLDILDLLEPNMESQQTQ